MRIQLLSLLVAIVAIIPASARGTWWEKRDIPVMQDFDKYKFSGSWYELKTDKLQNAWSDKHCKKHFFAPTSYGFKQTTTFNRFWASYQNESQGLYTDQQTYEVDGENVTRSYLEGKDTSWVVPSLWYTMFGHPEKTTNWHFRYGIFQPRHEYVIDTDYENYAVLYGHDRMPITGGILANERFTYLSRDTHSNYTYISSAIKFIQSQGDQDEELDYSESFEDMVNWVDNGRGCGWKTDPTITETMIQLFWREPQWDDYSPESVNTLRVKQLFDVNGTDSIGAQGTLSGYMNLNDCQYFNFQTFSQRIKDSWKQLIYISNLQYESGDRNRKVDMWVMANEDMTDEDIETLEFAARSSQRLSACCYVTGDSNRFNIKSLIEGFARVIVYRADIGIEYLAEGEFSGGNQIQLGRYIDRMPSGDSYFNTELSYFGWNTTKGGQAIVSMDEGLFTLEGFFPYTNGFPNGGKDFVQPDDDFVEYALDGYELNLSYNLPVNQTSTSTSAGETCLDGRIPTFSSPMTAVNPSSMTDIEFYEYFDGIIQIEDEE